MTGPPDIRLFLADVDGALVTKQKELTEAAKAAVQERDRVGLHLLSLTGGRPEA